MASHAPDKLLFTIHCTGWVFTVLDISPDIMIPWLSVSFDFNIHAFFDIHAIGWVAMDFYV